jgi:hypothetical protein
MDEESVELADAIAALRAQLGKALRAGKDEEVRFRLGPVELEFTLNVKKDIQAEGGVKFWVVSLGTHAGVSHDNQHRVKLSLQPIDGIGDELEVHAAQSSRPR